MKLLVTGAAGFIGAHIVDYFAQVGWQVCGLVRRVDGQVPTANITWRALELPSISLGHLLSEVKPDLIVHAAASANVGASLAYPAQDFMQSVVVWNNVLESVRLSQLNPSIVFLSSAAIYGNPQQLPIDENAKIHPISPYGYHKWMCEEMAQYYAHFYGLKVAVLRIFSAYGVGLRRQLLWDVTLKALRHEQVELHGVGDESRDFIHVKDICRAIQLLSQKLPTDTSAPLSVFNLGSGTSTSIRQVAEMIVNLIDPYKPIFFNGNRRHGDPLYWQADISKITSLGFKPETPLVQGISAYVGWVQEQLHV